MADPERFDADPDPTFYADADPDPNFLARKRKKFFKIFNYIFQYLTKLVMCNFLNNNYLINKQKTDISIGYGEG